MLEQILGAGCSEKVCCSLYQPIQVGKSPCSPKGMTDQNVTKGLWTDQGGEATVWHPGIGNSRKRLPSMYLREGQGKGASHQSPMPAKAMEVGPLGRCCGSADREGDVEEPPEGLSSYCPVNCSCLPLAKSHWAPKAQASG